MKKSQLSILLVALLPAAAAAQPAADLQTLLSEASAIAVGCHDLALNHFRMLERGVTIDTGKAVKKDGRVDTNYLDDKVVAAEMAFLRENQQRIDALMDRITKLEGDRVMLGRDDAQRIPMGELSAFCRLAATPHGATGFATFDEEIAHYYAPLKNLKNASFGSLGRSAQRTGTGQPAGGREVVAAKPLDPEELRRKKERWAALQQEEQARARQELDLQQAELEKRNAARDAAPLKEAKVAVRKDLPAAVRKTPEEIALAGKMSEWHKTYSLNVNPFKEALSRLLSTPKTRAYARREACGNLYVAAEALIKARGLDAPDPAVAGPAAAMAGKFRAAANFCLEGKTAQADQEMQAAEQELGRMAAALGAYSLQP